MTERTRYHIHTTVEAIYQPKGSPNWFVHFEGSREALSFGEEKPEWEVGDKVHITFMKE
jgi:hypothetical protein